MRIGFVLLIILHLSSCGEEVRNQDVEPKLESKIEFKQEVKSEDDFLESAHLFVNEILNENIRIHTFGVSDHEYPEHLRIFQNNGLIELIAYSSKNYPKKVLPNKYEYFILFVGVYNNPEISQVVFDRIKSDSKYGLAEGQELNVDVLARVSALNIGAKSGGIIVLRGKHIFSLVKTCRGVPNGGKWKDYENKFLGSLGESGEEVEILNANCGNNKYEIKRILLLKD